MKLELARMFIPAAKVLNDNHGQHYKTAMGKLQWIQNQTELCIEGFNKVEGFTVPKADCVREFTNDGKKFSIVAEVWKCERTFDPINYSKTFKMIVDTFTKHGYWVDDNFKYCHSFTLSGGDHSVWVKRAIRFQNDGLPNDIKKEWWLKNGMNPKTDIFIRIIVNNESSI